MLPRVSAGMWVWGLGGGGMGGSLGMGVRVVNNGQGTGWYLVCKGLCIIISLNRVSINKTKEACNRGITYMKKLRLDEIVMHSCTLHTAPS